MVTLNISLPEAERLQVVVTNSLGQVVDQFEQGSTYGGQYQINLETQAEGMYFVQIRAGEAVTTQRIVITR
jgi:hypothetical protein